MKALSRYKTQFAGKHKTMSLSEYLESAKSDPSFYLSPAERMLKAIGTPRIIETGRDPKLNRIYSGRKIKVYDTFSDFFGLEEVVEKMVSYFIHSAQGLEERKQILYLLGPVGGGKSSLAERLKLLMEKEPFYAIEGSPIFDNPLSLFSPVDSEELGIPERYLTNKISPWLVEKLKELGGDISKLKIVEMHPNQTLGIALTKTEPGDENTQDVSTLTGKVSLSKIAIFDENHPYAYNFSGGLCRANRGMLEFVEMFKAPIKVLHPLLTATQEGNYNPTNDMGAIPFDGLIVAHSNESEWQTFKENKNNEAFLDRVYLIKVPNVLQITENEKILAKLIDNASLKSAPLAPYTLSILSKFMIFTRLAKPENSDIMAKILVYDGQHVKDKYPNSKTYQEYRDPKTVLTEGMGGMSTRTAYKIISKVFNFDATEVAADGIHMILTIQDWINGEGFGGDTRTSYLSFLEKYLSKEYQEEVEKDLRKAFFDSYDEYCQSLFDKYITYADNWIQDQDYINPDTGQQYNKRALEQELSLLEKPAGIANPKDFRHEVVNFALRFKSSHKGDMPRWDSYSKLKEIIERHLFNKDDNFITILSSATHSNKADAKKYENFVDNMKKIGYTNTQILRVVDWFKNYKTKE